MKILISGSEGQLGRVFRRLSLSETKHVFFYYNQRELDITNKDRLEELLLHHKIDVIINCAAYTLVDKAEENTDFCNKINHLAVKKIGEVAHQLRVKVIHFSTDYVFDGTSFLPYKEEDKVNPQTVYGESKWKGEQDLLSACPESVIIRTSWLYSDIGSNFLQTMLRLGKERQDLKVVFDQIGTPTSAEDLAQTVLDIIDKGLMFGVYHYSNEGVCSWYDFAKAIFSLAGIRGCEILPVHSLEYPTKAKRPHYSVLDKTKIKKRYELKIPHWYDSLCGVITKNL